VQAADEDETAAGVRRRGEPYEGFVPGLVCMTLTLLLLIWSFAQTLSLL
jgi:hypothetical protein